MATPPAPEGAETAPPLLPEGSAFEGLLTFRGTGRVEGELRGRVVARGRLEIGPAARVRAAVDVDELVVEGRLEGELRARVRAELRASARVRGPVLAPRVAIAEGAVLEGPCRTGRGTGPGIGPGEGPAPAGDPVGEGEPAPPQPPAEAARAGDSP